MSSQAAETGFTGSSGLKPTDYEDVTHVLLQSGDFLFRLHQFELQITDLSVGVS